MSSYLVLLAVLVGGVVVVLSLHVAASRLARRAAGEAPGRAVDAGAAPGSRPRAWGQVSSSATVGALTALGLAAGGLPLLLWGSALREDAVDGTALAIGGAVLVVLGTGVLHALRRGEVLRR